MRKNPTIELMNKEASAATRRHLACRRARERVLVVFVLTAGLVAGLTRSWALGAVTALILLVGGAQHAVALALDTTRLALGLPAPALAALQRPLEFSRLFAPQLTFVPLAGGLWALWLARERRSWRWAVVAGLALGVLIPSYASSTGLDVLRGA